MNRPLSGARSELIKRDVLPKYQISENGGLGVFPGSHLKGPQRDVGTSEGIHHCDQVSYLVPPPECLKSGQNFLCNNASSPKKVETLSVPQSHLSSSSIFILLAFVIQSSRNIAINHSMAWHGMMEKVLISLVYVFLIILFTFGFSFPRRSGQ